MACNRNKEAPRVAGVIKFALLTAQRKGEVLRLRWSELDLEAGWWTLPAGRSKNKLSHRIPLGPQALALSCINFKAEADESPYVFSGARGGPISNLSKAMRALRVHGELADFRFHDLRRTAASHMTGIGVPRLVVAKILNHVEHEITAVYDRHSYDGDKQRALLAWDRHLAQIVAKNEVVVGLGYNR